MSFSLFQNFSKDYKIFIGEIAFFQFLENFNLLPLVFEIFAKFY